MKLTRIKVSKISASFSEWFLWHGASLWSDFTLTPGSSWKGFIFHFLCRAQSEVFSESFLFFFVVGGGGGGVFRLRSCKYVWAWFLPTVRQEIVRPKGARFIRDLAMVQLSYFTVYCDAPINRMVILAPLYLSGKLVLSFAWPSGILHEKQMPEVQTVSILNFTWL